MNKSKVAVLKTNSDNVIRDYGKLMRMADELNLGNGNPDNIEIKGNKEIYED